jgi:hypothetical protein
MGWPLISQMKRRLGGLDSPRKDASPFPGSLWSGKSGEICGFSLDPRSRDQGCWAIWSGK